MKLTTILLLSTCLTASAKGYTQRVSISVKNAPLETVLKEIKKQTGFQFLYNNQMLDGAKKVSIQLKDASLEEALNTCFAGQPFTYEIVDRTIIIKPLEKGAGHSGLDPESFSQLPPPIDIHGRIVNEKGEPVIASVQVKGTSKGTTTNDNGEFELKGVSNDAVLLISGVSIQTFEWNVDGQTDLVLNAKIKITQSEEVQILSTGYQQIPKERATGSFVQINNELLNRRVSTDILSRLEGVASGVFVYPGAMTNYNPNLNVGATKLGINVRGQSTLLTSFVSADPLIVVDNFPYDGDIRNINPNDVETITILKDAASASIWGARSANGVIVITTKKGRYNEKTKIDFNSNVTIGNKPELFKSPQFLSSSDYIDVEKYLFNKGYFDFTISNPKYGPISPAVQVLANQRAGLLSSSQADAQLNSLKTLDVRNDFEKYVFQKSTAQQYSLGLSGGSNELAYKLSIGYDKNQSSLVRNSYDRITIQSYNLYSPLKALEITGEIRYSQEKVVNDNSYSVLGGISLGYPYGPIYPYAQLADANGNHLYIARDRGLYLADSMQNKKGYLNWKFNPLDEIHNAGNTNKANDLVLHTGIKYKFSTKLFAELQFQNQRQFISARNLQNSQSYYARNLINVFTQNTNGTLNYPIPLGGVLDLSQNNLVANNVRGQINYRNDFGSKHAFNAITGAEIRQQKTTNLNNRAYGYDQNFGTTVNNIDYKTKFPTFPSGSASIPTVNTGENEITYRYISYYANVAYTYDKRYTITLSGRKDGSNIFGVNTNDKIVPLWSTGVKWDLSKESFYKNLWLPNLAFRASYGYNGNVYNGSAYLIANYDASRLTGAQYATIGSPPNPELRWEKVRNMNIGFDFGSKEERVTGTFEWYQKNGKDIVEKSPLAPSTGFIQFTGNAATTQIRGVDITLNSKNIDGRFKWFTTLLYSTAYSKVTKFDQKYSGLQVASNGGGIAVQSKPIYGVYSFKWGGLDPTNGDPQGYLNKAISKNYTSIINNAVSADSLVYDGSAVPTQYGALRNTFSFKGFTLSANIIFRWGYVFRRPTTPTNYGDILLNGGYMDYEKRWQQPGDEKNTNVPSLVYPSNTNRNNFYKYSEATIEKGDNIRLQDISVSYDLDRRLWRSMPFQGLQIYTYINNLGIIWRANKKGIDPDVPTGYPYPKTVSLGIKCNL